MAGTWRAELAQKCESCLLHVGEFLSLGVEQYGLYRCVSRLPPVSFYRTRVSRVSRVCPGSPRCLFTGTGTVR